MLLKPSSEKGQKQAVQTAAFVDELLQQGLSVRIRVTGKSMKPFLRDKDMVTLEKTSSGQLRPGDMIFFRSDGDCPVLHRIVAKKQKKNRCFFYIMGDALTTLEGPVYEDQIMGRVCYVERKGLKGIKYMNINRMSYRMKSVLTAFFILFRYRLIKSVSGLLQYLWQKPVTEE